MQIAERTAAWRRERRVLARVSRAAWRLDQAGQERSWALTSARRGCIHPRARRRGRALVLPSAPDRGLRRPR